MLWYVPVIYVALACATVKPAVTPTPTAKAPAAPSVPSTQPVPNWAFACKALNEAGVQTYPSLNPG